MLSVHRIPAIINIFIFKYFIKNKNLIVKIELINVILYPEIINRSSSFENQFSKKT